MQEFLSNEFCNFAVQFLLFDCKMVNETDCKEQRNLCNNYRGSGVCEFCQEEMCSSPDLPEPLIQRSFTYDDFNQTIWYDMLYHLEPAKHEERNEKFNETNRIESEDGTGKVKNGTLSSGIEKIQIHIYTFSMGFISSVILVARIF